LDIPDNDLPRAICGAQAAPNAGIRINDPGPCLLIQTDGLNRADIFTERVLTLFAQYWFVDQVFPSVLDAQGGQPGVEPPVHPFGADKLADFTPGTEVEMRDQPQPLRCLKCLIHKKSLKKEVLLQCKRTVKRKQNKEPYHKTCFRQVAVTKS
jgi:hypothetical protein